MVNILARLEAQLTDSGVVDIPSLGGAGAVLVDEVASSAFLDDVVAAVASAWTETASPESRSWILLGLRTNGHVVRFANALDALLGTPALLDDLGPEMASALLERSRSRTGARDALIAAIALEAALRLAVGGYGNRHAVLAALTEVTAAEDIMFAMRVARLLGVAYDWWPDEEVRRSLEVVAQVPGAEADAAVELGMTHLRDAVSAGDRREVLASLEVAQRWFERAEATEEDREDAAGLRLLCGILLDLASDAPPATIGARVEELRVSTATSALYLRGAPLSWLRPRATTAVELFRLVEALSRARTLVDEPSWRRPGEALAETLDAYTALRSVQVVVRSQERSMPGIAAIVEPAIEAGFVRQEGLRHHLRSWLEEVAAEGDESRRVAALSILAKAETGKAGQRPFRHRIS